MKIEIEHTDLGALESEKRRLQARIEELEKKIKSFDEDKINQEALKLAEDIFDNTLSRTFKELGFKGSVFHSGDSFPTLTHWLGTKFWESDKLYVTLGAQLTEEFKEAFIRLGVVMK